MYPFHWMSSKRGTYQLLYQCMLYNSDPDRIWSCVHSNGCTDLVNTDLINSKTFFDQIL